MNAQIITTLAAALGMLVALWSILSNFDKRNGDRFTALNNEIKLTRESLRVEIGGVKETLRAEIATLAAQVRLEIRDAGERRIEIRK